jgi:glycosyltransferase involved in cell wall biosynthesis
LRTSNRIALAALAGLAAVICLGIAGLASADAIGFAARAWLLTAGFCLLTLALVLIPRASIAPILISLVFVVYGGVSALVAVPESAAAQAEGARTLTPEQIKASQPAAKYKTTITREGFRHAALLTALAGLAAIGGSLALSRGGSPGRRAGVSVGRVEYAGKALVVLGFAGVAAALTRFALTQLPADDLFLAFKSMWEGGSYFLLLATFAVPGFGLWLTGLLERRAARVEYLRWGIVAAAYLALLVPTGQRGFAVALALMVLAILVYSGRISARAFAGIAAAAIVLIGLSQAARNELRETGGLSPANYVHRLAPHNWRDLYGSQLASFNWTVLIDQNRDRLNIPDPFPRALLKPIPRQLYPGKSQGFGSEFTKRVYPGAYEQKVSFAIPLTAESDYAYGTAGVLVVFLLLGALAGFSERRIANRAPPVVAPIAVATIAWCVFCLVRGDFANAIVVSAGWILPLLLVSRAIGLRSQPPIRSVLVDALQVAPEFSGIGRRIEEIGRSFGVTDPGAPVAVRCAGDVAERLRPAFPAQASFETPLPSSRPRLRRIAYQQLIAPLRDGASTLLVCPGDQAPLWGRAPLVFVIHDVRRITEPRTAGGRLEALFYRLVIRAGARRAERILTISEFSRGEILRTLEPSCQVEVVPSHPEPREPVADAGRDSSTFVAVGALRPYKGLATVVEALACSGANGGGPTVICVGGEEARQGEADRLARQAREHGVEDRFRIAGWVSDEELAGMLARCAATVSASSYEGYGLPVAESLAAGIPTIASDIPAHREVAGEAALYFPPGDAEALAAVMSRVASDAGLRSDLARRAAERARILAAARGSWGEAIRRTVEDIGRQSRDAASRDPQTAPAAASR